MPVHSCTSIRDINPIHQSKSTSSSTSYTYIHVVLNMCCVLSIHVCGRFPNVEPSNNDNNVGPADWEIVVGEPSHSGKHTPAVDSHSKPYEGPAHGPHMSPHGPHHHSPEHETPAVIPELPSQTSKYLTAPSDYLTTPYDYLTTPSDNLTSPSLGEDAEPAMRSDVFLQAGEEMRERQGERRDFAAYDVHSSQGVMSDTG